LATAGTALGLVAGFTVDVIVRGIMHNVILVAMAVFLL
jgi:hypothetical protein